jgi:hypothetical protein
MSSSTSTNYDGLTRNVWPGTWSPSSSQPIVLDTEIRGTLQSITGNSGDRLTDIYGQRLQEGMLVYVKTGYTAGGYTRTGDSYYTYKLLSGDVRNASTGAAPNTEANWSLTNIGYSGSAGSTGSTGYAGSYGAQGDTGYSGSIGAQGYVGSYGAQGDTGYTGSFGAQGYQGFQGDTGYTGSFGAQGYQGESGLGFTIAKTYASVAALTADTAPTGIIAGQFAIINTSDVENSEDSRLYLWNGSTYTYVSDLSGAQGIKGEIGYTGSKGVAENYVASITAGTGVTITNNTGSIVNPTIEIGQSVGTGDSVTFTNVTVSGDINVSGTSTFAGIAFGQNGIFPPVLDASGTSITYDGITTGTMIFSDGTVQGTRAPVQWTNAKFISVATYYNIDPGIVFSPVIAGGYVYPGDTYFDDGSFGTDPNHLFVMTDIGGGQMQFVDITQK